MISENFSFNFEVSCLIPSVGFAFRRARRSERKAGVVVILLCLRVGDASGGWMEGEREKGREGREKGDELNDNMNAEGK